MNRTRIAVASFAVLMIISACSPATQVTKDWKNPAVTAKSKKLLVIVLSKDKALREKVENEFVMQIGERGGSATASYRILGHGLAEKDQVRALVEKEGFDSVLTMRVMSLGQGVQEYREDWLSFAGYGYYGGFYDYYGSAAVASFAVTPPPSGMGEYYTLTAETNLYSIVGNGTLAWTGQSQVSTERIAADGRKAFVKSILGRLSSHHLM